MRPILRTDCRQNQDITYTCARCGHTWHPMKYMGDVLPTSCPGCRKINWQPGFVPHKPGSKPGRPWLKENTEKEAKP